MADNYRSPSFGYFVLRVGSIVLAVVLFGFVVWGIFQIDGSSFLAGLIRILSIIFVIAVIGSVLWFGLRMLLNMGMTIGRILSIALGLLVVGFIIWGIFKIADSSDFDDELATEVETVQSEEAAADPNPEPRSSDSQNQSNAASNSNSNAAEGSVTTPAQSQQIANTGGEDLPNTGPNPAVMGALSAGILFIIMQAYVSSKRQLFEVK